MYGKSIREKRKKESSEIRTSVLEERDEKREIDGVV